MIRYPDEPAVPPEQRATAPVPLRYEDVAQDGRVLLLALPQAIGATVWQALLARHPVARIARQAGVIPILTRLVVVGERGPFTVESPLEATGGFQLAHTAGAGGEVERLILNAWARVVGPGGRAAGAVFAEHVFTRPFAPPGDRRVTRLGLEGLPGIPPDHHVWRPPGDLLDLPEGAEPLEAGLAPDDAAVVFGLTHTDGNQHVNSLVYPRLFEDAALRRLATLLDGPARVLARRLEVAFRKPCFAGDRARIVLRAFRADGRPGALGAFVPESGEASRPFCTLRVLFEP